MSPRLQLGKGIGSQHDHYHLNGQRYHSDDYAV